MSKNSKSKKVEPIPVIDPRDKIWKTIGNLTKGKNPSERAKFLIEFVESIQKHKSNANVKK